jgi:hypothetical protein
MSRYWIGAIETLTDACRAQRMLAFCLSCGHGERFDPRNLLVLVGDQNIKELEQASNADTGPTCTLISCLAIANGLAETEPKGKIWLKC